MVVVVGKNEFVRFIVGEPEYKVYLAVVRSEFSKFKIYDDDQCVQARRTSRLYESTGTIALLQR